MADGRRYPSLSSPQPGWAPARVRSTGTCAARRPPASDGPRLRHRSRRGGDLQGASRFDGPAVLRSPAGCRLHDRVPSLGWSRVASGTRQSRPRRSHERGVYRSSPLVSNLGEVPRGRSAQGISGRSGESGQPAVPYLDRDAPTSPGGQPGRLREAPGAPGTVDVPCRWAAAARLPPATELAIARLRCGGNLTGSVPVSVILRRQALDPRLRLPGTHQGRAEANKTGGVAAARLLVPIDSRPLRRCGRDDPTSRSS